MFLIAFTIALAVGLLRLDVVLQGISWILGVLLPALIGFAIAFILRVPLCGIESTLEPWFVKKKCQKYLRTCSMLLTLILLVGLFSVLIFLMVPEIQRSVDLIRASFPQFWKNLIATIDQLLYEYPELVEWIRTGLLSLETLDWSGITAMLWDFLQRGNLLGNTVSVASSIVGVVSQSVLGFIFAMYFLANKEKMTRGCKRILYASLPESRADSTLHFGRLCTRTFSDFISGQCLEALILATIMFFSMTVVGLPYALVISVLIGFTSFVPIFGAFIGCAVGTVLILIVNPMSAVWFIVLFLVIQQIEGNFIYPRVVGNSVGLPSVFVLLAVTLGASTWGVLGMILYIPLFSVFYQLMNTYTAKELRKRKISQEKTQ